jgi:hypothetical protein
MLFWPVRLFCGGVWIDDARFWELNLGSWTTEWVECNGVEAKAKCTWRIQKIHITYRSWRKIHTQVSSSCLKFGTCSLTLPYGITIFIREQSLRLRSFAHSRDRCPTVMSLSAISPSGSLGQSDERQNESATEGEKAAKRIRRVHRDPSRLLELVN